MRFGMFFIASALFAQAASPDPQTWRRMVEADWLAFEESLAFTNVPGAALRTTEDASGGCDGVKNGQWGFHTGQASQPWWQVDLGERQPIARVRIWNRCDAADRAARLQVLISDDARQWQTVYQHGGTVFYGATDGKPLEIKLDNPAARFLRVQLPGTAYLHLDEVEIFGPADPARNLLLVRGAVPGHHNGLVLIQKGRP